MKVSMIQMDMLLGDPAYNFSHAEELVRKAAKEKPDVITLPETWNVGFFPKENLAALADQNGENVKKQFSSLAKEYNVNIIAGSVANCKDNKVYNTSYTFDRQGICIASYDKTHLFTPMGEDDYFATGDSITTFTLDGIRCGILICYDIRFLEIVRCVALTNIDVLFVVAQWPEARAHHWNILNTARAIENQMFVCCTNSCGTAEETKYGGHSAIINPWGDIVTCADNQETILTGELDLSIVHEIRSSINIYRDRRPKLYSGVLE